VRPDAEADLPLAAAVFGWITAVLLLDRHGALSQQRLLGLLTWAVLVLLLRRESVLVRVQVGVVVAFATVVEYTFSPLLEVYVYRFDNVPAYVPPGHGLVYLCALALGRSRLLRRHGRALVAGTVVAGGAWAAYGVTVAERTDALGMFWYACLLGFLAWGRSRLLYVGAFLIVSYLEVLGTWAGTWEWQPADPTGIVPIGNPPSGAAGGYGWFDLAAVLLAPRLVAARERRRRQGDSRARTASCSRPLVATALPPPGPGVPSRAVNRPPASSTTTASAARSCRDTCGSQAMSTDPSATSM
jgi:hypothetical protein